MAPLTTTRTTEQVLSTEKRGLSANVGQIAWSAVADTLPSPSGLEDAVTLALLVAGFSVVVNVPENVADWPPANVPRLNVCGVPLCGVSVTVTL